MAARKFNFVEAYRTMRPDASREIVEARQKSHDKLSPLCRAEMPKAYQTCRLAFQIPQDVAALEWFEKSVKEFDPQFVVSIDKAEAGRIASLLLGDLIDQGSSTVALAVLASSYCGQRRALDIDLLGLARDGIGIASKNRRVSAAKKKIVAPSPTELKPQLDAIQREFIEANVRSAIQAVLTDVRAGTSGVAASAADAHDSLRRDVALLAEEVDMLWWFVGDWIELLDKPRSSLPTGAAAIAAGAQLGDMVRQIPGPYGAYGILSKAVAQDTKINLHAAIASLEEADLEKLALELPESAVGMFLVHGALQASASTSGKGAEAIAQAKEITEIPVTPYELAVQTLRERILIEFGGLEQ